MNIFGLRWTSDAHARPNNRILAHTTTRLLQMSVRAIDTLENMMDDEKASSASRVSASRLAMDMIYRGAAIDDIIEQPKTVEAQLLHLSLIPT